MSDLSKSSDSREWNDIWRSPVNNFFFEKMFPVVIEVEMERKLILFTSLPDNRDADLLICKSDGPAMKMDRMKFWACVHEMILLDKVKRITQIERIAQSHV